MLKVTPMPAKVRELIDSHGAGIPHMSWVGDYRINVYPEVVGYEKQGWWDTFFGVPKMPIYKKVVTVVDKKTGKYWREISERFGG
jgi:hypothetical protein